MARPKKFEGDLIPLGFRLPVQLIDRLDAFRAQAAERSGFSPSRTDVIRMLLERGLVAEGFPHAGADAKAKGKAKR